LNGAIAGVACAMIVTVLVTRHALVLQMRRAGISNWWREAWSEWPVLLNFSLPAFLTSILFGPIVWICNAMLANQPNGYAELGIYNAANQWYSFVLFIPGVLFTAVLPVMAERHGANDWATNERIMIKLTQITLVFVVPLALVLSLMRSQIMGGYGEAFHGNGSVFVAVITAGSVQAVTAPAWHTLVATGRMWLCFWISLIQGVLWIFFFWMLLKNGSQGLAFSRLIAVTITGVLIVLSVKRKESYAAQ
jgi:O-antigen/teichoic acid export membrane protein